ncbi:MAG: hypothetical protein JRG94_14635 [Deltaproteobacteria bacterium]|nr:hypothetical protein [Deltaproteobacteria bacterium]
MTLPDLWARTRPEKLGIGWYRFEFDRPDRVAAELGVYIPQVESNASVFINGHWVGSGGPDGTLNWNQPLYVPFPAALLKPGVNTVEVRVETHGTPDAGLISIEVGPHALLYPRWLSQWRLRVGATEVGTSLAVFAALLFGAIWLGKSRDAVYGWCCLCAISWGINSLNYHVQHPPVPFWFWKWFVHAGLDLFAVCMAFLVLRMIEVRMPRVERAILIAAGLGVVITGVVPHHYFYRAANLFHLFSLSLGIVAGFWLIRGRGRLRRYEFGFFGALAIFFNALLVRDYAIQVGALPAESVRFFHLTAPGLFLCFAATLLLRFISTYRDAERTNVILEQRVREKQAELERNFWRLNELERSQAVSDERERIMREMHDGLGGHLVSALSMVDEDEDEPSELADALRGSLEEMRLVIHSLDSDINDITALLGTLRERLERRMRRAGLSFRWQVTDVPEVDRFGPEHFLHILRIFQEAITNALKHASAKVITVATGVYSNYGNTEGQEHIFIRIADDGCGVSPDLEAGYGIQNMTFRARALDGELHVKPLEAGTMVELRFPVNPC